jgi:hypothetical protein
MIGFLLLLALKSIKITIDKTSNNDILVIPNQSII